MVQRVSSFSIGSIVYISPCYGYLIYSVVVTRRVFWFFFHSNATSHNILQAWASRPFSAVQNSIQDPLPRWILTIFKLNFGGGNLFSPAMTSTVEGNNSVGSLLKPLLKKVNSVVGSRILCSSWLQVSKDGKSIGTTNLYINTVEGSNTNSPHFMHCAYCRCGWIQVNWLLSPLVNQRDNEKHRNLFFWNHGLVDKNCQSKKCTSSLGWYEHNLLA